MNGSVTNNTLLGKLIARSDMLLGIGVIAIIAVLVIPIPTWLLDFALAFNITFSLVVLLTSLYVARPTDLSVFPGMLLLITLMRLALNVASTRLILGKAYAGEIINSFGNFVVQGSYIVGAIIFVILVIIQFVVITKGAVRVSEVSARFTLDAMPGKQMAIDADRNSGAITEVEAQRRRKEVAQEADFYGAMDGASKFVRGDAIAGLLITIINIFGGLIIGLAVNGMSMADALRTYTLLSIGDGLVTQIPALLVSTAAGLIVTRAASTSNLSSDIVGQLTRQPKAIAIAGVVLFIFALLPGMPTGTFLILGGFVSGLGYVVSRSQKRQARELAEQSLATEAGNAVDGERTEDILKLDTLGLEIGFGLIPLVDAHQGGDLLSRITSMRRHLAAELGIIVPPIRIRDNLNLAPNEYRIMVKGVKIDRFELVPDHLMAINPGKIETTLDGFSTTEPAYRLAAIWIAPALKSEAEEIGYSVVEPVSVLTTHLTETIRMVADELLTRQDVHHLINTLAEDHPTLVASTIPEPLSIDVLHRVLQGLLAERTPIRDMATIVETTSHYIPKTDNTDTLIEHTRVALKRQISELYKDTRGWINAFNLDSRVESQLITDGSPAVSGDILEQLQTQTDILENSGLAPVCVCSPEARRAIRRVTQSELPRLAVVASDQLTPDAKVVITGTVRYHSDN